MALTASQVETIFKDFGLFVRMGAMYGSDWPAEIYAETLKKRTQIDTGEERLKALARAIEADRNNIGMVSALVGAEVQIVGDYITDYVKPEIQASGNSAQDVLADLAERMLEECSPVQYVLANDVALDGSVVADTDNDGDGTLGSIVLTQRIRAQRFTVECIDVTTLGAEVWTVTGSVEGQLDNATTGATMTDSRTYLELKVTAGSAAFAVGDKFYFYVICTEQKFQTFFRDNFGVVFPSATLGSETIDEDWAS